LLRSDSPEDEYALWVGELLQVPEEFRHLKGVNTQDLVQCCSQLFPWLKNAKAVVDYYMLHHVFPVGMKEFPDKLSTSGWTLAKTRCHPLTGFSGTNDNQRLLPLPVKQRDLLSQLHTNAAVLTSLMNDRNVFEPVSALPSDGGALGAEMLLRTICGITPPIRVLIDVGAQVLEWQNLDVAREWLALLSPEEVEAAVFFDAENEILVLDRHGRTESFNTSPFFQQLDKCVIYLDEIHTRGTDFRFPRTFRAAVTLDAGPKDRLVQGKYTCSIQSDVLT
jgi:hypothetical protein